MWNNGRARLPWPTDEFYGILTWGRLRCGLNRSQSCGPVASDTLQTGRIMKSATSNINYRLLGCVVLIPPVSAKAAKGTACLSLLSDSSAMATWPLICSSWLGRWIDWQMDAKTSPIRLQSSSLVQSCRTEIKRQPEGTDVSPRTQRSWLRQEPTSISTTAWATFRYPRQGAEAVPL